MFEYVVRKLYCWHNNNTWFCHSLHPLWLWPKQKIRPWQQFVYWK